MTTSLKQLVTGMPERELELDFGDSVIHVTYNPANACAADVEAMIATYADEEDGTAALLASCDALAQLLTSWDISETEGGPALPITAANVKRLPLQLLNAITAKVQEDQRPPKGNRGSFGDG